jgi:protein TonB
LSSTHFNEKAFLYLLLLSVVLHAAGILTFYLWPDEPQQRLSEATFIDLQDMPQLNVPESVQQPDRIRPSDRRQRVLQESAPKPVSPAERSTSSVRQSAPSGQATRPFIPGPSAGDLLRRKPQSQQQAGAKPQPNLMPSASRMAQLEDAFRRRFAHDVDEGTTRFLNTEDIKFGSFLRRFETAVYGVWRYPQEAAMKGVEGVTPVKISFNRNGEIVKVQLLESSGSRILDDEVFRTLRLVGPMGNLPKTYEKEEFHLIAFFQYGNARGRLR